MYVTLNRSEGKIFFTYYDGNCGYFIDDTEENQRLLNFPAHLRFRNKVNLDYQFMRTFWGIIGESVGRLKLVTNALVDIRNKNGRALEALRFLEDKLGGVGRITFSKELGGLFHVEIVSQDDTIEDEMDGETIIFLIDNMEEPA